MIIKLLIISLIIVFIIDISGAIDSLKKGISYLITRGRIFSSNYRLKPIDCSLCTTFWIGLLVLLITGNFTIPYIGYVCLLAYFSDFFKTAILLVKDILIKVIQLIYKVIDRL